MNEEIFDRPEFKNINKETMETIKRFARQIKGKSTNEIMSFLMANPNFMSMVGNLSDAEKAALLLAIKKSMTPEELKKFNKLLNLITSMGF